MVEDRGRRGRNFREFEPGIRFVFAGRGNRFQEFQEGLSEEGTNIKVAGFAEEAELEKRLTAADMHLMSLRANWDGIVVPSKFFGSLAVGRPVLYAGSRESDIGQWIRDRIHLGIEELKNLGIERQLGDRIQLKCGMILNPDNISEIAEQLVDYAANRKALSVLQKNAFTAYQNHFFKKRVMDEWDELLRRNLGIEEFRDRR